MRLCRCCIVSPYVAQLGGAELSLLHALRVGATNGVAWALTAPGDGPIAQEAKALGMDVDFYGASRTRNPYGYISSIQKIAHAARRHAADLVLAWDAHAHFRGFAAAALAGVPAAWFQKGTVADSRTDRWLARLPARAILANSLYTAQRQTELLERVGRSRPIHVVPSAVDLTEFDPERLPSPEACRKQLDLPPHAPLIALVGRLQAWKGFHLLIEAFPRIRAAVSDAQLLLVGGPHWSEPAYLEKLQSRALALGVADAVHLVGQVPHQRVKQYMQAADVVVHASVGEPFGIVVIEGMALGKPVVAADQGGPATVVQHDWNGLLTNPQDPVCLSAAIVRLLREPAFAREIGRRARDRARLFALDEFGRRLADALRSIVADEHRSGTIIDPLLKPHPNVPAKPQSADDSDPDRRPGP